MMNLFLRKEVMGETTRLVLDIQEKETLDMFALNMISRNRIGSLVPIQLSQFNNERYVQYDISNKNTLALRLTNTLKKAEVEKLLNSMIKAFEEVEAYMLDESSLYLDWNYIFVDEEDKCFFIYLPFEVEESKDKMEFFQTLVEQIKEDYTERETYIYDIRNAFSRGALKKIADLKDLLKRNYNTTALIRDENLSEPKQESSMPIKENVDSVVKSESTNVKSATTGIKGFSFNIPGKESGSVSIPGKENISLNIPGKENMSINIPGKEAVSVSTSSKSGRLFNIPGKAATVKENTKKVDMKLPEINLFGKKTVEKEKTPELNVAGAQEEIKYNREKKNEDMYESYEHTGLLVDSSDELQVNMSYVQPVTENVAKIVRKNTLESIEIKKSSFSIGSGKVVDYCIADNKTISRSHALIQSQNGKFYFIDNHSTNGSWVDGRRVEAGERIELYDDCIIRLSDEIFTFKLL